LADYFLKLDGIAGESTDAKHKGEIELVSFSWGVTQAGSRSTGGGGGAGKAQFKEFQFLMRVNKASPQLFLATVSGKHIKEGNLSVRRSAKVAVEYLKIKFTDVLISSYEQAGGGDVPEEAIAFNFAKIEMTFLRQQTRGAAGAPIEAGWDLSRNLKI
jgi:type VI secretion system secreted protein Hcp